MKRYFPLGALMMFLLTGGVTISTTSKAQLIFSFSVTNTAGTVAGTFKGEIFGLIDNSTSSATKVLIESFPSGLNSLASPPVDAILWNQQNQNSFTVSGGQITAGGFWADKTVNGNLTGFQLFLNGSSFNYLNLDGKNAKAIWGANGINATNFSRVSPAGTPEPGSYALFAGVFLCGAVVRRRRFRN